MKSPPPKWRPKTRFSGIRVGEAMHPGMQGDGQAGHVPYGESVPPRLWRTAMVAQDYAYLVTKGGTSPGVAIAPVRTGRMVGPDGVLVTAAVLAAP